MFAYTFGGGNGGFLFSPRLPAAATTINTITTTTTTITTACSSSIVLALEGQRRTTIAIATFKGTRHVFFNGRVVVDNVFYDAVFNGPAEKV